MIGELIEKKNTSGKSLSGSIRSFAANLDVELEPAQESANPNAPSHRIYALGSSGLRVRVGAAWTKVAKRGDNIGEEFITLSIDVPSQARRLNVAAFKNRTTDVWEVGYRRRQEKGS